MVRENRSVLDFIRTDYTFMNERLATHYGIEGVRGTAFRKVMLEGAGAARRSARPGQHPDRHVLWQSHLAREARQVDPGQPARSRSASSASGRAGARNSTQAGKPLNAREQMELHRSDPACASCHVKMDPLGLSLERYDPVGAVRSEDAGRPIDASARMPDGTAFDGLTGLQNVLLDRKDEFVHALTERCSSTRSAAASKRMTSRACARSFARPPRTTIAFAPSCSGW